MPSAKLMLHRLDPIGLFVGQVVLFRGIVSQMEQFDQVFVSFFTSEDQFVGPVNEGASSVVVLRAEGGLMKVSETARQFVTHVFDQGSGTFLQGGSDVRFGSGTPSRDAAGIVTPKAKGLAAFGHGAVDHGNQADAVQRTVRQGDSGQLADGGQHVACERTDIGCQMGWDA